MAENVRLTAEQLDAFRVKSIARCAIINMLQKTIADIHKASEPLRVQVRKELEDQRRDSAAIWVSANNVKLSDCWVNEINGNFFATDLGSYIKYIREQHQAGQRCLYFAWNNCLYDTEQAVATGELHEIPDVRLQDLLPG